MNGEQIASKLNAHFTWLNNEFDRCGRRFIDDGVDFIHGDWSNHPISCAILFNSIFDNCDLHGVDFFQAELQGSTFNRANLANAVLTKSNIDGCVFDEASMLQLSARKVVAVSVSFIATVLIDADLRLSSFIGADFSKANLSGANLSGCAFEDCKFCDSDLTGVKGLESVNVDSSIIVGSIDAPVVLHGDAATEWMRNHESHK